MLQTTQPKQKKIFLKNYTPPPFLVKTANLHFTILNTEVVVDVILKMMPNPKAKTHAEKEKNLFLNGTGLTLKKLILNENELDNEFWQHTEEGLTLFASEPLEKEFTLKYTVTINPFNNTSLEGMYKSGGVLCTQNEAEGFRKICFYPDRPDVLASFTTTLTANKEDYPVLLGGGNLISESEDGPLHSKTYEDPAPKPCYLFAAVAGKLYELKSSYTRKSGRPVNLFIYSEDENLEKCTCAMQSLQSALAWDEEVFELECDLDDYKIVAVDSFNFGAMENKGLNVFNSSLIFATPETTTDREYINIEAVIAHEYFHNWSGNRITLRDWFQLTLKEGLTVYRDQEFTSDMHSKLVKRIEDVSLLREYQFSEDSGPLAHPIQPQEYQQINNFYTLTIYEKGAAVVRMYQTLLGRDKFLEALKIYFSRYDGMAITVEEFFLVMQEHSEKNISQFKRWYHTYGTPTVSINATYNKKEQTSTFHLKQFIKNNTSALPLMLPLKYSVLNKSGEVLQEGMHIMCASEETILVKNSDEKTYISLNQGFSAPVKISQNISSAETSRRTSIETDDFNRWDLLQNTFLENFVYFSQKYEFPQKDEQIEAALQNEELKKSIHNISSCLKKLLLVGVNDTNQTHYISQCFQIPSIRMMIATTEETHFSAIKSFRKNYLTQIATNLENELLTAYETLNKRSTAPARALKNIVLNYLFNIKEKNSETLSKYAKLVNTQMLNSNTMTDCYGAFSLLTITPQNETPAAIDWFYKKWQHNNLVMNKWLAAQAAADHNNVIAQIKLLAQNPVYNIKEPNKIRALLGVFAMQNFYHFHKKNGEGYRFVAEKIIALDKTNPMMSSQLLTAFSHFKKLPSPQKQIAQVVITEIASSVQSVHAQEIANNLLK